MINILFSGNSRVFDGILTCCLSILKRTKTTKSFNFIIFTMDVSHLNPNYTAINDELVMYLDKIVKTYNQLNQVTKIDVTKLYNQEFAGCLNEGAYCSPYTLLRLLADLIEMPDKLLYLDVDLMFNRDIELLWNQNLEGYEYAAAKDHYGKKLVHPRYINAGVLLLNMKEIKQTQLFVKARQLLRERKLMFADQSAIIRSTTKRKLLSQRFNDQKYLHKKTVVRHFSKRLFWLPYPHTANVKQWHVADVHRIFKYYQFDDIYEEYNYYKLKYQLEIKENFKNE